MTKLYLSLFLFTLRQLAHLFNNILLECKKKIDSENIGELLMFITNNLFSYLTSQQTTQKYLEHCYMQINEPNIEKKSYENYNAFLYYLDHGKKFYEIGNDVDIVAKPVLYFYGLSHLLKACLITKRPHYPESTQDLSHGVTTRKRKKRDYTFMDDEVKVQQKGLFPYFSKYLYSIDSIPFEKIQMRDLFSIIPELTPFFSLQGEQKLIEIGSIGTVTLNFPSIILDNFHLTTHAFVKKIEGFLPSIISVEEDSKKGMVIQLEEKLHRLNGPFFIHQENNKIYFPLQRNHFIPISEVMVHYLLLYNLSMLSRYEAEWWGDLLTSKSEIDYPFITQFLHITAKKIPVLLEETLYQNVKTSS